MPSPARIPLRATALEPGARRREPVTFGVPFPAGLVREVGQLRLIAPAGEPTTLQAEVTKRHPDGSIAWCLVDCLVTMEVGGECPYAVEIGDSVREGGAELAVGWGEFASGAVWAGDPARGHSVEFRLATGDAPAAKVPSDGAPGLLGPVRRRFVLNSALPNGLVLSGTADYYPGCDTYRIQATLVNPSAADHPGGNWDLGNGGSIEFAEFGFHVVAPSAGPARLSAERGQPLAEAPAFVTIHQESSGGANWRSPAHVDRTGQVRLAYKGYRATTPDGAVVLAGGRATPLLARDCGGTPVAVAVPEFWENFPKSLAATADGLAVGLFPRLDSGRLHELQGGERKTHTFALQFGPDAVSDPPHAWLRSPLSVTAAPEWLLHCGVVSRQGETHDIAHRLVREGLSGDDSLVAKREKLDEYGWRNFGDLYGDHEAVYHKGDAPLVSHYNNQYDCVLALLEQYIQTGEWGFYSQGLECALHTCDIDIYHTAADRPAYNGGLFWHTYHYADAGTGTHRSYPRALTRGFQFSGGQDLGAMGGTGKTLQKVYAVGGGPAGSHNYNAGLALAYCLTGNPVFRDCAVNLAEFVVRMDAPRGGLVGLLSRQYSGLATESSGGYHGPGRASANSVLALLAGFELTGEGRYLDYADLLIRRVSHPAQNLDALDLLNAELRWFYTMYLQALGEYIDALARHNLHPDRAEYARAVLLHYARWMAGRERPILDAPEKLQYPTETWAAQDLRKTGVFDAAAKYAETAAERARFLERADYFYRTSLEKLNTFQTRTLCRPLVLVMRYGRRAAPPAGAELRPLPPLDSFGAWRPFTPQKQQFLARARLLAVAGALAGLLAVGGLVAYLAAG